jgi:hypothetical protein
MTRKSPRSRRGEWTSGGALALLAALMLLVGCSSATVKPVRWQSATERTICVKDNPGVVDPDLLPAIQAALARNGLSGTVFPGARNDSEHAEILVPPAEIPAGCDYVLTYSGTMWWDLAMYLNHAEFRLQGRNYEEIGFAVFHIAGHGGLDLGKYRRTETKVGPVLDEMLTGTS